MPEQKINVGNENGEGIELSVDERRVFISGQWKGRTSKSKKGNWNIAWFSKELFDELIGKYTGSAPEENSNSGDEEEPF